MSSDQHSETAAATRAAIDRFNEAFNRHDADALAPLLTDDTVFEDTSPAPDGQRIEGKAAVLAFWRVWFAHNADASFEAEDVIVSGDRAVVRWVYRKLRNGQPWHLHGVDVFTVRDGKVAAVIPDPEVANQDKSQISGASGIAIDAMGSVYAADVAPHNVRKYVKR